MNDTNFTAKTQRRRGGGGMERMPQTRCAGHPRRSLRLRVSAVKLVALAACAAVVLAMVAWPSRVFAHPLGNFTVNRYARVEPGERAIRIVYALDMAEIPTFQEMPAIDRDRDSVVSDGERDDYLGRKLPELARGLRLTVDGTAVEVRAESGALTVAAGQGGLQVLRIDAVFLAALPASLHGGIHDAQLRDTNYDNRLGWKEIVVHGTAGAAVRGSSVATQDISNALRGYPENAVQSPLDVREARFRFEPGVSDPSAGGSTTSAAARVAQRTSRAISPGILSRFADSAAATNLTLPVILFSLMAAVFWGALHALGPGHGKTVVAAYLVGSRGTARHAVVLGLTVTATHTAGVYLLGVVTLTASHFIVPERLYPILSLTSGLLVVGMGVSLLAGRLRGLRNNGGTRHRCTATHTHDAELESPARLLVLAGAGHVSASPAEHQHHVPEPDHDHQHQHDDHGHHHSHTGEPHHDHGHGHSHAVPGMDGTSVSWRSLMALGIYGGLIRCPTAIVVLLTSISLDRVGFGMLLVVAFSAGLAVVLTGIGLALVYAGRALNRVRAPGAIVRVVPVLSASAVLVAGLLIFVRALGQAGL